MNEGSAIWTENLVKRFGSVKALGGLNLSVKAGSIFALLGRNGAGKTTAIRTLATLIRPDEGRALVCGLDVVRQAAEVRRRIGLTGQFSAVDGALSGRENLVMFGRLYGLPGRRAKARASELIERFGLAAAASRPAKTYSGGMRRRLDLAAALLASPQVLFLDEPTTGLDPASRTQLWEDVRQLAAQGTTVVLTTQYLEEADRLADRIAFLDAGRIVAEGSPAELKAAFGNERMDVTVGADGDLDEAARALGRFALGDVAVDREARRISLNIAGAEAVVSSVMRALDGAGVPVSRFTMHSPTLDEVFLSLTKRTEPAARSSLDVVEFPADRKEVG
jgi:ABC-2 type transport system ATP-binding protein